MKKTHVVLVLPVYTQDQAFLSKINTHCIQLAAKLPMVNWVIIIVNDGSPFQLKMAVVKRELTAPVRFCYYQYDTNMGKGYAVRFGLLKGGDADIFVYTDYDFPFGTEAVIQCVRIMATKKVDIVAGNRGDDYLSVLPHFRKMVTQTTRAVNKFVLRLDCTDTQAGLKAFNNRSLPCMLYTGINGFLFDLAFIKKAEDQGLNIYPLPVDCTPSLKLGNFRIKTLVAELFNFFIIANLILLREKSSQRKSPATIACGFQYNSVWEIAPIETVDRIAV